MMEAALPLTILPEVVLAGRFGLDERWFQTVHLSAAHALHLHDYRGTMRLAGQALAVAPGDVTLSPAGLASSYDLPAAGRHWCVHFRAGGEGGGLRVPLHLTGRQALRERFAEVAALHARGGPLAQAAAGAALQQLLLTLVDDAVAAAPDLAERAAATIDERFAEDIRIGDVAAAVGRSPAHLARAFRRRFGVTIPHRIIQRRVAHARFLLESTDLPIWRVAERCGIPDPQHFNKTVRRVTGASPSAIRAASPAARVDPDR